MYYNWEEKTSTEELKVVCNLIKNGELVIFPTETVYGIGANAFDAEAVGKIFNCYVCHSDYSLDLILVIIYLWFWIWKQ